MSRATHLPRTAASGWRADYESSLQRAAVDSGLPPTLGEAWFRQDKPDLRGSLGLREANRIAIADTTCTSLGTTALMIKKANLATAWVM